MFRNSAEIEREARLLPPQERARLAQILIDSLRDSPAGEIEAAWEKEIAARLAAYDRGEVKTYAAEEVFAEARRLAEHIAAPAKCRERRAPARRLRF